MSKDKIDNIWQVVNAALIVKATQVQNDVDVAIRYLESFTGLLPATMGSTLYNTRYQACTTQQFLILALKKQLDRDRSVSYGAYYFAGSKYSSSQDNHRQLFACVNSMHEPAREIIFRNALTPGSSLNIFFRERSQYEYTRIRSSVNKIEVARDLLRQLSSGPLNWQTIESLAKNRNNKEILLDYIRRNPDLEDRNTLVRIALKDKTNLHQFFSVQRGPFKTSITAGTLRELNRMNPDPALEEKASESSCFSCF